MNERLRQPPSERYTTDGVVFDLRAEATALRAEATAGAHGHRQKTLFKEGGRTIALFVMEAGASLREHAAAGTVTIQAIEGEIGVRVAGGEDHRLRPGALLVLAPQVRHDVRASAPAVFLLQVSLATDAARLSRESGN